jgi:hypothetical protein
MVNYANNVCTPIVMSVPNSRFQIAELQFADSLLEITWQDKHYSRYPGIWLLEACNCALCGDTETAVRHTRLTQKPHRPELVNCNYDEASLGVVATSTWMSFTRACVSFTLSARIHAAG